MHFINMIKNDYKNKDIIIFVDMDGVISDYEFGKPLDFLNKRPIITNINTLKKISLLHNVELCILSVCKKDTQITEKNKWLDKHANFFINRVILSKESYPNLSSKDLKYNYLKKYIKDTEKKVLVIDDDNTILKYLSENIKGINLYQDSSLVD